MYLYAHLLHSTLKIKKGFRRTVEYNVSIERLTTLECEFIVRSVYLTTHVMTMTLGWLVESYPTVVFVIRRYMMPTVEVKCRTRNTDTISLERMCVECTPLSMLFVRLAHFN